MKIINIELLMFLLLALILGNLNILNAKNMQSIKIGYLPITDHLLIIAEDLYKAPFTAVKFSSWADLSEALRAKAIDGAFILTPLALKLKSQNLDIKALFAAHRNGSALVVRKGIINKNNKEDISLLKGLKIAIPSRFSTHYLLLVTLLKQGGLGPNDVKLIDMPPSEMVYGLISKSIDAFIVAEPFAFIAQIHEIVDVFRFSKDIIDDHICCVLAFHQNILDNSNDEIRNIVDYFMKTADFIQNDHKNAAIIGNKFLGQKIEVINNLLDDNDRVSFKSLKLNKSDIELTLNYMRDYKVDDLFSDNFYENFVDSSFIDSVIKVSK